MRVLFILLLCSVISCKKKQPEPKYKLTFYATSLNDYISFETIHEGNGYTHKMEVKEEFTQNELNTDIKIASAKYLLILVNGKKALERELDGHYQTISLRDLKY